MAARSPGWLLLPLTATGLALWQRLLWVSSISDDGLTLANASIWAGGRLPYRDFILATPPGAVAPYAALFKLTGIAYPPARALTGISVLLGVAALWDIGRRLVPSAAAAVAATLYGTWSATFLFYEPHHLWSVALPVVMVWALVRAREGTRRVAWAAAAGLAAGLAVLVVQTSALPAAAGLLIALLFLDLPSAGVFAALSGVAGATVLGWLLAAGLLGDMWRDVVVYPATTFRALNPVQTPWLPVQLADLGPPVYRTLPLQKVVVWLLAFAGSLAVCLAAIAVAVRPARWRSARALLGIAVVGAAGLDLSVLLARPTGPLLWLAAALNLQLAAVAVTRLRPPRWVGALVAVGALVLAATPLAQAVADGCGPGSDGFRQQISVAGGSVCVEAKDAPSLSSAADFGHRHAAEGVVFLAIITPAYTLAGTAPPIAYVWVAPDTLTPVNLDRLESELSAPGISWIVSAPRLASAGLHPGSSERAPDGRWALDVYVDDHFDAVGHCGDWKLYRARGLPPAPIDPCAAGTATAST